MPGEVALDLNRRYMRKASPVIRRQGAKPPEFVATKAAFANPLMPGVRGHNKIAKATAAALAYAGLLSLPMRLPGQKQPKAKKDVSPGTKSPGPMRRASNRALGNPSQNRPKHL